MTKAFNHSNTEYQNWLQESCCVLSNPLESGGLLEEAIEAPFYDLVSKIGRKLVLPLNDAAKSNTVLAQDTRFMSQLEDTNLEETFGELLEIA